MFSFSSRSYEEDLSALEKQVRLSLKISSRPFVKTTEIFPNGNLTPLSQVKENLNWQSINVSPQNQVLKKLDTKSDRIVA